MQNLDEQIFVVPGLLGLLINLMIIIPSQVPLDESPVYNFLHDWVIGLYVLHICIALVSKKLHHYHHHLLFLEYQVTSLYFFFTRRLCSHQSPASRPLHGEKSFKE